MSSKEYFDQVAGQWDEMRTAFFSEEVREKAYAIAGVRAGETAADIGAGTGFVTEGLLALGLRVIAVDQSEAMLAELGRKCAASGALEGRQGTAEHLPLADGEVDHVFANMYLHHVEDPLAAIHEMARILKPGGHLVITDLDEHGFEFLRTEHFDRWLGFRREDVERWLREAGLNRVSVVAANQGCRSASADGTSFADISIFAASGEK